MSEFSCTVVEVGKVGKHPNADRLEITQTLGYPCVVRAGDLKAGDWAVYVPVDAMVPLAHPAFAFLQDAKKPREVQRIRAAKLRGIFSMGLLIPIMAFSNELDPSDLVPGTDVAAKIGVTKYEPKVPVFLGGEQESPPCECPVYDVEQYRKYHGATLVPGEHVVVTEKIHGVNARFTFRVDEKNPVGKLYAGSHKTWKRENANSPWWQALQKYNLEPVLKALPDIVLYGELYGRVQDLKYGSPNDIHLAFFDAFSLKLGRFLDYPHFANLCQVYGLPRVPVLYEGAYDDEVVRSLVDGPTTVWHGGGAPHMREGVVVKPVQERWHYETGRVILKLVGEDYLTRKNGTEYH